jgi:hypothetical protein
MNPRHGKNLLVHGIPDRLGEAAMFKTMRHVFSAVLVATACMAGVPAVAATPSSGTLSTSNLSIAYSDGPFTLSNPTGATGQAPNCSDPTTSPCSQFALTVSLPNGFVASRTGDTTISMSLFVPGYDVYSVYLEDASGNVLAYNLGVGATVDSPITAFTYKAVDGNTQYKVVVVPTVSATGTFDGTLTLAVPPPKSEIAPGGQPLYRLYSPTTKDHLLTLDPNEYASLGSSGWTQQGQVGLAYPDSSAPPDKTYPVYRLYNAAMQQHLWTMDPSESSKLIQSGWQSQGIAYRAYAYQVRGTVALYRLASTNGGTYHLWTSDYNEYTSLCAPGGGWVREGIGAFVAP